MPKNPRYYWDANVFLSYIEETPGRIADIEALLEDAEAERCEIYTSVLTIAEVAFAEEEKKNRTLDPSVEARIATLWSSESPVKMVEVFRPIVDEAHRLVRASMQASLGLKPMDALHLATAHRLFVDAVHTYDVPMQRNAPLLTIPVVPPAAPQLSIFSAPPALPAPEADSPPKFSGNAFGEGAEPESPPDEELDLSELYAAYPDDFDVEATSPPSEPAPPPEAT